jgi:hypothetical protein
LSETDPLVTLTLSASDWQLVVNVCQQSLVPYHRLGQVLQQLQLQAQHQQQSPATEERGTGWKKNARLHDGEDAAS